MSRMDGAKTLECLNGCHDLPYGADEATVTVCTCTDADTMDAVRRLNARGYTVVFQSAR